MSHGKRTLSRLAAPSRSAGGAGRIERAGQTVYEGARLITGDGSRRSRTRAFVVENGRFTAVGRRGELQVPPGAVHVDLAGKTVMPTIVDLHGHIGFQNIPAGTMSKETFTRENLIDHLQRLAFNGVGAVVGIGDLVDRSDMKGGRTGWGDVPLRVREEVVPGAALFQHRRRRHGVARLGRAGRSVAGRHLLSGDDRRGGKRRGRRLRPHEAGLHQDLGRRPRRHQADADAARSTAPSSTRRTSSMSRSASTTSSRPTPRRWCAHGIEGWLHVPVRQGEVADDEIVALVKDRVARDDRPMMWMTPSLITAWMNTAGRRPAGLARRSAAAARPIRRRRSRNIGASR